MVLTINREDITLEKAREVLDRSICTEAISQKKTAEAPGKTKGILEFQRKMAFCQFSLAGGDYLLQDLLFKQGSISGKIIQLRANQISDEEILETIVDARDEFFAEKGYVRPTYQDLQSNHHCHRVYDVIMNSLQQLAQEC